MVSSCSDAEQPMGKSLQTRLGYSEGLLGFDLGDRFAIFSRIRGPEIHACSEVSLNRLATAHRA